MKYVLGIIGLFVITVVAIILVTRGRGTPEPAQKTPTKTTMSQQAKQGTSAELTTAGKLVGETERRSIRINISRDERRLEILTGYEEAVDQSFVFPNTGEAYETFLVALDQAGFTSKRESTIKDERGACPIGYHYTYEFKEYSQKRVNLWSTSCGSSAGGTFNGKSTIVRQLFKYQIPDYEKLVRGVRL